MSVPSVAAIQRPRTSSHRASRVGALSVALLSLVAGVFAFANAAANNRLPIASFAGVGSPFYAADTVAWGAASKALVASEGAVPASALRAGSLAALSHNSFGSLGHTTAALAIAARGNKVLAHRVMDRAVRLSRRDRMAQVWLFQDAAKRNDVAKTLYHFDVLLRTIPDPAPQLFQQVVPLLQSSEGREALVSLVRRSPNWVVGLIEGLTTYSPSAAPVAQVLIDADTRLPSDPRSRSTYAALVSKLADQEAAEELLQLYPRLPGTDPKLLRMVAIQSGQSDHDYSPVRWDLAEASEIGGNVLADGASRRGGYLQLFAASGHSGVAASKLFEPRGERILRWRVLDKVTSEEGLARVVITCLGQDRPFSRSPNLLASKNEVFTLPLPPTCPLIRIDIELNGGRSLSGVSMSLRKLSAE